MRRQQLKAAFAALVLMAALVPIQPLSRTATFDGTWRGNMNAAGFTARAVGDGTFGLERSKMKIDLQPLPPDQIPSEIQAILGQSPWTECAVVTGVGHWAGFVRVRSQD